MPTPHQASMKLTSFSRRLISHRAMKAAAETAALTARS